jgi:cytochrome c peroxidase
MQFRSISWVAVLLLFIWLLMVCLVARGETETLPPPLPPPLSAVPVPEPAHLDQFVADRAAAIRLGKALFWDMQVGSDGIQACGSCHFQAGADPRRTNQLNPDLNGSDPTFAAPLGPNATLTAQDFPFHRLANPADPASVVADRNDVVGSQGVFLTMFVDIVPGSAADQVLQLVDPVFNVQEIKTRRVEPRNAPTVIDSVFNHRNFWDGRAQSEFNGVNPFGSRDPNARVLKVDLAAPGASLAPSLVTTGIIEGASLASLACGPAVNPNEMSASGRTLPKLGKKMLSLQPLARQLVAPDDSVLGPLSRAGTRLAATVPGQTGLNTTYAQMIQVAFRPEWWQSPAIVTFDARGTPAPPATRAPALSVEGNGKKGNHPAAGSPSGQGNRSNGSHGGSGSHSGPPAPRVPGPESGNGPQNGGGSSNGPPAPRVPEPPDGSGPPALTTSQYTVMEANFSLFFGLSIQLYLATLVSSDTPLDRYVAGHSDALNAQQQAGLTLFFGKAGCARCHVGSELTEASYAECYQERIDELTLMNGGAAKYDKGFINSGVRPIGNDPGIGGSDPYGYPLSDSRRLQLGQLSPGTFNLDVGAREAIAVDGAFKIPGLRNVELTGPYFHNGGTATLEQVVQFYNRGGDFTRQNRGNVRDFMVPLGLTSDEQAALVAFLKSLTDERVRFQRAPFDHPRIFVPNGHPATSKGVISDGSGKAQDALIEIPAVGAGGGPALSPVF